MNPKIWIAILSILLGFLGIYNELLNLRIENSRLKTKTFKAKKLCCYFGQHYHQCYTGKAGCDIGAAIGVVSHKNAHIFNGPQVITCSETLECPGLLEAGFFLRGFKYDCPEC